ncbi:DUF2332 domain-containing protein [Pukyongiella litopenaei]|uniref:DUF2332 family protein n=1 Tax=Pukyongiella litopenaei TaxID=2605946 RepID=A0A2S0MLJ2_9RHOB|nr:DUF2332 family protein [Pukyongiella litopenaei]AVO36553.1 DUF2332 family protein [Pukyongiella litopenaei]
MPQDRLISAFDRQARACAVLGSPFMARLMTLLAEHWPETGPLNETCADWPGDPGPSGASLPLRIAGGLHALVLQGRDPELTAAYPPHDPEEDALVSAILGALDRHRDFLIDWITSPPQTNETGRSAVLIPTAHLLARRFGLPLTVSELGASGGLNLNFDRFALTAGTRTLGPADPVITLSPDWTGEAPAPAQPVIADRRGVDLRPLDPRNPRDALRLLAYLWPDQPARIARTRAVIAAHDAPVDAGDAIGWLDRRLRAAGSGTCHLVYTTIAWQYFPADARARGQAMIEATGARADDRRPLAWFAMESDGTDDGAALTLRLWPGNERLDLGRAGYHGEWVRWEHREERRDGTG